MHFALGIALFAVYLLIVDVQYKATIGADFLTKEVTVDDRLVTMQVCKFFLALVHVNSAWKFCGCWPGGVL